MSHADELKSSGLKATGPRLKILEVFQRASQRHMTAEDVYKLLLAEDADIGLATVYRTLQQQLEDGQVDVLRREDGESVYRRCQARGHHHHLVCRTCGRTVEVSGPAVERWASLVAAEHGFRDVSHDLEIFGTCADC